MTFVALWLLAFFFLDNLHSPLNNVFVKPVSMEVLQKDLFECLP